jgi:hypothetical protein
LTWFIESEVVLWTRIARHGGKRTFLMESDSMITQLLEGIKSHFPELAKAVLKFEKYQTVVA